MRGAAALALLVGLALAPSPTRPPAEPTRAPTGLPTRYPSRPPNTGYPSRLPTGYPSRQPSRYPSGPPIAPPSSAPTAFPITAVVPGNLVKPTQMVMPTAPPQQRTRRPTSPTGFPEPIWRPTQYPVYPVYHVTSAPTPPPPDKVSVRPDSRAMVLDAVRLQEMLDYLLLAALFVVLIAFVLLVLRYFCWCRCLRGKKGAEGENGTPRTHRGSPRGPPREASGIPLHSPHPPPWTPPGSPRCAPAALPPAVNPPRRAQSPPAPGLGTGCTTGFPY
eukprot:TRINITY_DN18117_c0_g1_i1.p1 TRINITY_DN18117_c0_g1~~TRINITY_DN18117_c0_g1_i1.p1  ORF type:complete len:303 (+),score=21.89 TRINITY_DN18117_c0_g1_i1:86-910(+)